MKQIPAHQVADYEPFKQGNKAQKNGTLNSKRSTGKQNTSMSILYL